MEELQKQILAIVERGERDRLLLCEVLDLVKKAFREYVAKSA